MPTSKFDDETWESIVENERIHNRRYTLRIRQLEDAFHIMPECGHPFAVWDEVNGCRLCRAERFYRDASQQRDEAIDLLKSVITAMNKIDFAIMRSSAKELLEIQREIDHWLELWI